MKFSAFDVIDMDVKPAASRRYVNAAAEELFVGKEVRNYRNIGTI
jgi:hypothetical protein